MSQTRGPVAGVQRAADGVEPDGGTDHDRVRTPVAQSPPTGRAGRTRQAIVAAARRLYAETGGDELTIGAITSACGISRAGFYTYFRDQQDLMSLLGTQTFIELAEVVDRWAAVPVPAGRVEVAGWVTELLAFLDGNGAFLYAAARSTLGDEGFRSANREQELRVTRRLGAQLRRHRVEPGDESDEALGTVVLSPVLRCWHSTRVQRLPVSDADLVRTVTDLVLALLASRPTGVTAPPHAEPADGPAQPVLDAARRVFVERGYAGTTFAEVAAACGDAEADLQQEYHGVRELFLVTGLDSLRAVLDPINGWDRLPDPCGPEDVAAWVSGYLVRMEEHGHFIFLQALTTISGNREFDWHARGTLTQVAWSLGTRLQRRQAMPSEAADALGLAVIGLVSDTWFAMDDGRVPISRDDLVRVLTTVLCALLGRR